MTVATDADQQLALFAGGHPPTACSLKISGSEDVWVEYHKGQTVQLSVTLRIDAVHFVDVYDKDGYVSTERRHVGRIVGIKNGQENEE